MKSLILAAAIAVAALAAPADAATLRAVATVEDNLVRLGDLFDDLPNGADIAVAYAPAPGRRLTFDAAALMELARTYRISWRPQSRFDRVIVERAGRVIQKSEIMASLSKALRAEADLKRDVDVELYGRNVEMSVPLEASSGLEVRSLSYDRQSSRFTAVMVAGAEGSFRLPVSGRVHESSPVPVLRRAMGPGEIIRKDDIEIVRTREDRISRDVVTDPAKLIGSTPRGRLRA